MPTTDPRIDAYIGVKPPFARPILEQLRAAVHRVSPAVEETLRWSMPSFGYKGRILCGMAAFKGHATFGFWDGREVTGEAERPSAMGQFGRLATALGASPSAQATYDGFPPSCRREYLEWIAEAKRPETRAKRVAQAVEWMGEGKRRHWKYEKC